MIHNLISCYFRKYICAIEDFINDAETLLSLFTNIRVSYIGDVARTFRANITEEELEEAITEVCVMSTT